MNISENGMALIKHFESFFDTAYQDVVGVWTIGWGTVQYPDGQDVKRGQKCTREQAQEWLDYELHLKQAEIMAMIEGVEVSQPQFDALCAFTYNLGVAALEKSTLLRKIKVNPLNPTIVGDEDMNYGVWGRGGEFCKWINAGGKPFLGLLRRRKAEAWLYATGLNRFFEEMLSDGRPVNEYLLPKKI